jgi:hypothetical protein
MDDDGTIRFGLRLSDDLHQRITEAAKRSSRSVNSEMLRRLEDSFQATDLGAVIKVLLMQSDRLTSIEDRLSRIEARVVPAAMGEALSHVVHGSMPTSQRQPADPQSPKANAVVGVQAPRGAHRGKRRSADGSQPGPRHHKAKAAADE